MFGTILGYIGAILVLAFMIISHELGHFLAGRALGFTIDKFAIGFGPKLVTWHRKETEFSVRAFPIGGFCLFHGEDANDSDPKAFNNQKVWKRLITVVAGALANIIVAVLLSIAVLSFYGDAVPVVQEVVAGSPAEEYGLLEGDIIRNFEGKDIDFSIEMAMAQAKPNGEVNLDMTVERDGELVEITIPRKFDQSEDRYMAGFVYMQTPVKYTFLRSLGLSFKWLMAITKYTYMTVFGMFTGATQMNEVGGILMVTDTIQQAFYISINAVLEIVALLSVNLAVINLLPFPALDGGRLIFIAIEGIFKKPINREIEGTIHAIGMFVLFAFIFFLLYQDILRKWFGG